MMAKGTLDCYLTHLVTKRALAKENLIKNDPNRPNVHLKNNSESEKAATLETKERVKKVAFGEMRASTPWTKHSARCQ